MPNARHRAGSRSIWFENTGSETNTVASMHDRICVLLLKRSRCRVVVGDEEIFRQLFFVHTMIVA